MPEDHSNLRISDSKTMLGSYEAGIERFAKGILILSIGEWSKKAFGNSSNLLTDESLR